MKWLRRWFTRSEGSSQPSLDSKLRCVRTRYAELRTHAALCLYRVHQRQGQAARDFEVADDARVAARQALLRQDVHHSRAMVARARTALDRAHLREREYAVLRARADATLETLRRLGESIETLEHLSSRDALDEAERALELLEAEHEVERELGGRAF